MDTFVHVQKKDPILDMFHLFMKSFLLLFNYSFNLHSSINNRIGPVYACPRHAIARKMAPVPKYNGSYKGIVANNGTQLYKCQRIHQTSQQAMRKRSMLRYACPHERNAQKTRYMVILKSICQCNKSYSKVEYDLP